MLERRDAYLARLNAITDASGAREEKHGCFGCWTQRSLFVFGLKKEEEEEDGFLLFVLPGRRADAA